MVAGLGIRLWRDWRDGKGERIIGQDEPMTTRQVGSKARLVRQERIALTARIDGQPLPMSAPELRQAIETLGTWRFARSSPAMRAELTRLARAVLEYVMRCGVPPGDRDIVNGPLLKWLLEWVCNDWAEVGVIKI